MGGLHSKLERKSLVEKTNLGAAARLQSNMHSAVDSLSLNVQEYSEAQLKACTEFSSRIGEWKTYLKNLCIRPQHIFFILVSPSLSCVQMTGPAPVPERCKASRKQWAG